MSEYTVQFGTKYATLRGNAVEWTNITFATVFKSKPRAIKIASKVGGTVEPFYGKPVVSNKSFVAPKQSKINHTAPYRSC